jgi:hypothetical protein
LRGDTVSYQNVSPAGLFEVVTKTSFGEEVIDYAESDEEVRYLIGEYRIAWGGNYPLWFRPEETGAAHVS